MDNYLLDTQYEVEPGISILPKKKSQKGERKFRKRSKKGIREKKREIKSSLHNVKKYTY